MTQLLAKSMKEALAALDASICADPVVRNEVALIVGGGGAMVLAHGYPLATSDIDAVPKGMELAELDRHVKAVATRLGLSPDWLNPYFSTFAHTLPADYGTRLIEVFRGTRLRARALGADDLLIMKCFAHRAKDVGHAKALLRKGVSLERVEAQIESLLAKGIPGARQALDFLDDVREQLE